MNGSGAALRTPSSTLEVLLPETSQQAVLRVFAVTATVDVIQRLEQILPILHAFNIFSAIGICTDTKEFGARLKHLACQFEFHGKKVRRKERVPDLHEQFLTGSEWTPCALEALPVFDENQISCERHVRPPLAPSSGMHHKAGT